MFDVQLNKLCFYKKQTENCRRKGCVKLFLLTANRSRAVSKIWKLNEMDADHVSSLEQGGSTSMENCGCYANHIIE